MATYPDGPRRSAQEPDGGIAAFLGRLEDAIDARVEARLSGPAVAPRTVARRRHGADRGWLVAGAIALPLLSFGLAGHAAYHEHGGAGPTGGWRQEQRRVVVRPIPPLPPLPPLAPLPPLPPATP